MPDMSCTKCTTFDPNPINQRFQINTGNMWLQQWMNVINAFHINANKLQMCVNLLVPVYQTHTLQSLHRIISHIACSLIVWPYQPSTKKISHLLADTCILLCWMSFTFPPETPPPQINFVNVVFFYVITLRA